jgi:hypothetical protein
VKKLRVAIDIDNTLINYEELFSKAAVLEGLETNLSTKKDIKEYIKSQKVNWPQQWIRIQGQCYGNLIKDAPYYENALTLIVNLINNGHHIELVSHKSEKSFCNRFNLHKACLQRIEKDFDKINFFETRKEKTNYVNNSSFDLMIDDLDEVLEDINSDIIKLHFNQTPSSYLQVLSWYEIENFINLILEKEIIEMKKVGKQTFQLTNDDQKIFIKKFHSKERFKNELSIIKIFETVKEPSFNYPQIIQEQESALIFRDTGSKKTDFDPPFINAYKKALTEINELNIEQAATHAVHKTSDFLKNLNSRLSIYSHPNKDQLFSLFKHLKARTSPDEDLEIVICQPDMLKDNFGMKGQEVCLFDFESFGKDALIRPVLNAIHHSGHQITTDETLNLFNAHREMAKDKSLYKDQLLRFFDHNALEWLIIMSNRAYAENDEKFIQLVQQLTEKMIYNLENNKSVLSWQGELYDRIFESV